MTNPDVEMLVRDTSLSRLIIKPPIRLCAQSSMKVMNFSNITDNVKPERFGRLFLPGFAPQGDAQETIEHTENYQI